ncbi:hypothetical protein AgCh_032095 [Apium graveolens]
MKQVYDQHHRELSFEPGQFIWLKLQPYRQRSLGKRSNHKLAPKFFGQFKILQRIGEVAYKLELPEHNKIHDVFHISLLKEFKGVPPASVPTLPLLKDGKITPQPESVIRSRLNRGVVELLVAWAGLPLAESTWVPLLEF